MILKSVQLKNFRKHKKITLDFSERLNYIIGGNSQGKTSILESIFYLCTTRSHSNKSDSEAVTFNENEFEIIGTFQGMTESITRVHFKNIENKKYYFKDGKRIKKALDVVGKFPVVLLSPEDHSITKGPPTERRKFVDSVISQANGLYLNNLIDYNKILKQRSSLIGQIRETGRKNLFEELQAWSSIMVHTGSYLIRQRKKFLETFNRYIKDSYRVILGPEEIPRLQYSFLNGSSSGRIEEEFIKLLESKKQEEIARGMNLAGPHRDDIIFYINENNLKTYGSQGQHKTFQVVLRFAEFFYLKEITGIEPIFLLDDVFGELDTNRASRISEYLTEIGQAFITVTDLSDFSFLRRNETDKVIKLYDGEAIYA